MAKTEIMASPEKAISRPRDVLTAMRIDRRFERFQHGWPRWPALFRHDGEFAVPDVDVRGNTDSIVVEAELPGVDDKDVSVILAKGVLTVKGEKKHEKEKKGESYYLAERSFGSFQGSICLPETVEDTEVEAKFDKGVLKVTGAKKPEPLRPSAGSRSRRFERMRDGR
jgi:HSP20 family protein